MLSDTDSVHSDRRSGKPILDRRHSLGLQKTAGGPSALQVAARRIHRQNSGHAGMGFPEDGGIDLSNSERSGPHSQRGGSVRVQDSGFLSADDNGAISHESSQVSQFFSLITLVCRCLKERTVRIDSLCPLNLRTILDYFSHNFLI